MNKASIKIANFVLGILAIITPLIGDTNSFNANNDFFGYTPANEILNKSFNLSLVQRHIIIDNSNGAILPADDELSTATIHPSEYGFPDAYSSSGVKSTHVVDNFKFWTYRFRTGYIHNEYIVLSPIRKDYYRAKIEYRFYKPVYKIDIELSHWREFESEGLNYETGSAILSARINTTYVDQLDLLSTEINLTRNRTNPDLFTIIFPTPVYYIDIIANSNVTATTDDNKGRICIGDIKLYFKEDSFPLSGDELFYMPELWCESSGIQYRTNCYSYALNAFANPDPDRLGQSMMIGQSLGFEQLLKSDFESPNNLINFISQDAFYYNFTFIQVGKYETCPEGTYKIALFIDKEYSDFHFYRQGDDGLWSHKRGGLCPTNLDASNNLIVDPETCDREYIDSPYVHLTYPVFCGYFAVNSLSNIIYKW